MTDTPTPEQPAKRRLNRPALALAAVLVVGAIGVSAAGAGQHAETERLTRQVASLRHDNAALAAEKASLAGDKADLDGQVTKANHCWDAWYEMARQEADLMKREMSVVQQVSEAATDATNGYYFTAIAEANAAKAEVESITSDVQDLTASVPTECAGGSEANS